MSTTRPVMIVDGLNMFCRCYAAYPQMSSHGYQMGGCIGFLKTLRRLVSEVQPSAVYVCWESGGSSRRRKLYPGYKLGRRAEKLNRFYEDDLPDTEENRNHQHEVLIRMVKHVPVCQLYVPDCEGDDLVAYLACGPMKNDDKVIVSSDKDLYQLLDERTTQYSLHRKTFVTQATVMEDFRVQAKHFALAKALCGDPGDNVPGIKGIGFKTVAKLFPLLGLDGDVLLQDVIDYAHTHVDGGSTMYRRITEQADVVRRNWDLVYLDGSMLSATQQQAVDQRIAGFVPRADRMALIRMLIKEGIGDFDVEDFFYAFIGINNLQHVTGDK